VTALAAPLSILFTGILGALAVLQTLLIAGVPLGRFAWGGQQARLPSQLRVADGVSIAIYVVFAGVALARTQVIATALPSSVTTVTMWVIAAYLLLSVLPNLASKSIHEKRLMTPVSGLLALVALLIALPEARASTAKSVVRRPAQPNERFHKNDHDINSRDWRGSPYWPV